MTANQPHSSRRRSTLLVIGAFVLGAVALVVIAGLLININTRKNEAAETTVKLVNIQDGETDPAVWGQNYPRE